ncbi:hypothetical protein [Pedobacter caeni]|uniref:Uncharacterized protein n=1 Tax=Pedobacter caeni TaxID=288992 RepID=A0A1M4YN67_9SPHI|nr:hypothetical protein [Pedobacter caeni]SHF07255.1 hypothetical protein SAMN04488522_1023 [Pedobacter caeni]
MKSVLFLLLFTSAIFSTCYAQNEEEDLKKIALSDTILKTRSLLIPGPFDAQKALLKLFPGQYYNLSKKAGYQNELINWEIKKTVRKPYTDVNGDEGDLLFPFERGVATRLMNVMDFKDSTGLQYKVISFNHSEYDEEGLQTSRFTGGLLGLAKFALTKEGWKLRIFQPAIAGYGAFSNCPIPKPLLIGDDQYAFMIEHLNGGGGGPFFGALFLIAGTNGTYQQIMSAYGVKKTTGSDEEEPTTWSSEYSVPPAKKKYFRDIIVTTKGTYTSSNHDGLPDSVSSRIKAGKKGTYTITTRYIYKGSKGYEAQLPAAIVVK